MKKRSRDTGEQPTQLLRLPAVMDRTGLGRSTIYQMAAKGEFPRPHKIGLRASAWLNNEIQAWINNKTAASPKVPA